MQVFSVPPRPISVSTSAPGLCSCNLSFHWMNLATECWCPTTGDSFPLVSISCNSGSYLCCGYKNLHLALCGDTSWSFTAFFAQCQVSIDDGPLQCGYNWGSQSQNTSSIRLLPTIIICSAWFNELIRQACWWCAGMRWRRWVGLIGLLRAVSRNNIACHFIPRTIPLAYI